MAENKKYATLLNNTLLFALSNFGAKIISLLIRPYLTYAYADPSVMGVQSLMTQVTNLLIPVVSLGVSYAIIRFGLDRANRKREVFTNSFVTICLGFGIMLLGMPLVRRIPKADDYLLLLYLCVLMSCLRTLCTQFVRSRVLNRLVAVDGLLTSAALLGFLVLYLNVFKLGAAGYLLAVFSSDALSTLFVFVISECSRYLSPRYFNFRLWKEMLRYCLPMIPASISFWIINASDTFFVQGMCNGYGGMASEYWVGLLSTGYYLPTIISTLGSIFYEAWQLSAVMEEAERESFFSKVFGIYSSVMFCCASGVVWLCRPMSGIFFEKGFYDSWQFVPFLALASMCTCFNLFLNSVFVVYKRSTSSLWTMLSGAVLNVALNWLFIRLWGPVGVAPASFLSLLLVFLLRAYSTRGLLEIRFRYGRILVNFVLILAQIEVLYLMKERWLAVNTLLTALVIALNFRDVWSMVRVVLGRLLPGRFRR